VIQVDYSNEGSIQHALTGVDVVISTIPGAAVDIQVKIAAAAKNAGVKLFVPSEFGGITDGETEGVLGEKADVQSQLKALDMPFAAFCTGLFADYAWVPCVSLYTSGCFRLVDHRLEGTSTSTSRAGKCPLVATATSRLHLPPERILPDKFPIS
jgi:NmrA-like family